MKLFYCYYILIHFGIFGKTRDCHKSSLIVYFYEKNKLKENYISGQSFSPQSDKIELLIGQVPLIGNGLSLHLLSIFPLKKKTPTKA